MNELERVVGSYPLTPEMNDFIDAVVAGLDVKGEAFAGTGKSSTLRAVEKYHVDKKGLYICFNKTLEQDARKLFKGNKVDIYTAHSFALNSFPKHERNNIINRLKVNISLKDVLGFGCLKEDDVFFGKLNLSKRWKLFVDIVECYFTTASKEVSIIHFTDRYNDYVNKLISKGALKSSELDELKGYTIKACSNIANAMLDMNGNCPTTHDAYLKAWQLSEPTIDYDYIMFDEAQDASPVLLAVILKQTCQRIFVGDRFQSIYQFRGSVNAMDIIPFERFPLSQSFRYGQEIADLANKILHHYDDTINIKGSGAESSVVNAKNYEGNEPFLFLAHSNQSLLEALVECHQAGIPAKFYNGKSEFTYRNLSSLFSLHTTGKGKLPSHTSFSSLHELLNSNKQAETKYLATLIQEDEEHAEKLLSALEWSQSVTERDAQVHLATAHGSKGLEFPTVILSDDFTAATSAFGKGKPLSDNELYLLYVAITRAKKTLVIADELYEALQNPLAFTLNKTKPAECLLDNLVTTERVLEKQPGAETAEDDTASLVSSTEPESIDGITNSNHKTQPTTQELLSHFEQSKGTPDQSPKKPSLNAVGDSIKIQVGECKDTGEPLYWLPTDTNHFFNPNIAIVGTMGTGKTQTTKAILLQLAQQRKLNTDGEDFGILIFDYKDDYVDDKFIEATGATVLESNNLPINPFALFTKDKLAPVHTAKTFISTIGRVFKLGPKQNQMLKNCIDLAYEQKGIFRNKVSTFKNPAPTLRDVFAIYNSQDKVPSDTLMSALSDLYDYEVFETNSRKCKSLFDMLDNNIVVVKLSGTDDKLQSLIVALLLDIFYIQMHQAGKPQAVGSHRALKKLVLVDEADSFMSQNFIGLRKILKEGREFGVGCVLSTQGLDHFKTSENTYGDFMNSWICHRLNAAKKSDVESILNIDDKSELATYLGQLGQLEKHHALFINGKKEIKHQESSAFWKLVKK